jgi:hypothetical protein
MLKPHKVQQYILGCLAAAGSAGFEEMRAASGVSSSGFAYHLNVLSGAGLIKKDDKEYSLTDAGANFEEGSSGELITPPATGPKIKIAIVLGNSREQRLIVSDLLASDARIISAAERILKMKLTQINLTQKNLTKPRHLGDAYIKTAATGNNFYHIFFARCPDPLSSLKNDLPEKALDEIIFAKNHSDGHFFFERSY